MKQKVRPGTVPSIGKTRNLDNSYNIIIKIDKFSLDNSNNYQLIKPLFLKNDTTKFYFTDYYHTYIPTDANYQQRVVNTTSQIHEVFAVTHTVKNANLELAPSRQFAS